ncbi:type VI secretion system contractile sheath large subunit [Candidatus Gromoviella agglomerans]|uniref:type VI secretion system contractile sheath large subunit n=1 Tax=Candidatus Gromoviella agglomerans TaxID=2806609 RepID=UPI003B75BA46
MDEILRDALPQKRLASIDEVLVKLNINENDESFQYMQKILTTFNDFLSKDTASIDIKDPYLYMSGIINKIDDLLSKQMDKIIHNPEFLKFEGALRGLYYFVSNTSIGSNLKIKILNISKTELLRDLEKSVEFDQSQIFKKVYEEEYGTLGGVPYSCLIGIYDFGLSGQDIELLRKVSGVAAAAHVPFITGTSPKMFGLERFRDISMPRDLQKLFDSSDFAKWNGFRQTEDSRYVTLVLPRVLIRNVYGPSSSIVEEFNYVENVNGDNDDDFCWTNASFCLAQRIGEAFTLYGWTAAIRGFEGGGAVENLPTYTYKTADGDKIIKCPTEVCITDRREKELSDLGFLPLCYKKGTDMAVFFGSQTAQKPKGYYDSFANANSALSARLPYLLNVSRFAHYVKVMMRDKIGSFSSRESVRIFLQTWIANYVLLNDTASQEIKAKYPLREARVDIKENPASPGEYRAIFFLRPHFQMEDLTVSMRLVAKLPV